MHTPIDASIVVSLKQQIDNYENHGPFCISQEGEEQLYKGIEDYERTRAALAKSYAGKYDQNIDPSVASSDPQFFRKKLIEYIQKHPFPRYSGDPKKRETNPEEATTDMETFLGKQGVELYKLALDEEMNSKDFRNAVVIKSTTHFAGPKWSERPVVIVGGPSASGKSFAAQAAVEKAKEFLASDYSDMSGNHVIAADGGIVREVSQMRKLVIQLANNQGYPGIEDLYSKSKKSMDGIKDCVREAAFRTSGLGVVIPETFTDPLKGRKLLKQIEKLPDTKHIFTRVQGHDDDNFRKVVGFMGSRRAWKTKNFIEEELDLNKSGLAESKAYGKSGFTWGKLFSKEAEDWFRRHSKDKLYMRITNDLILLKPDPNHQGNWIGAKQNDEGAKLFSEKVYKQWKSLASTPDTPKPDFIEYHTKNSKSQITTSPQIDFLIAQKKVEEKIALGQEKIKQAEERNVHETNPKKKSKNEERIRCLKTREAFLDGIMSFSLKNLDSWHDIGQMKSQVEDQLVSLQLDSNAKKILSKRTMKTVNEFLQTLEKASNEFQNNPTFYEERNHTVFFKTKYNEDKKQFENVDDPEAQANPNSPA
ncbi:Uncharacterised protein [Legionella steigerwaltii]|uniref:Uncharacterized protein n=1 Tax=Legionella steigerwaltii TaxID=460 RepID=A0A378L4C9_9GAMM|nr:hypothetical protein [Legionella steigerwaltii]KTD77219.1 hypothetical protein Lstg_1576 [Legionella steigerwaltii]STY21945.1 Uncharacterised protein [Legionella steigerwaltii]